MPLTPLTKRLFAGQVLKVGIVDTALAHALVGEPVDMFEKQEPNDKAGLDPGRPLSL